MILAWRIVKTRYAVTAFDGEGARLCGGRWSSPGVLVAYASESMALATLEVLAHLRSATLLPSYSLVAVRFPDELVEEIQGAALPAEWRRFPAPAEVQAVGDEWVRGQRSAVLRVPSVVIPSAHKFLVNPAHPDFAKVVVESPIPFDLDPGLLKQ